MNSQRPPAEKIRPDDVPGLTICGYPKPGDIIWTGTDVQYQMSGDGYMYLVDEVETVTPKVSWSAKLAAKLMCPACFLPRFFPGHGVRGCKGD